MWTNNNICYSWIFATGKIINMIYLKNVDLVDIVFKVVRISYGSSALLTI